MKFTSLATTVPPEKVSSLPPPIHFSSLAPPPYVATRRDVHDLIEFTTPSPQHHTTQVSYSTPSSNVYINSFPSHVPDTSFYHHEESHNEYSAPKEETHHHVVTPLPAFHNHVSHVSYSSPAPSYEVPTQDFYEAPPPHHHQEPHHHSEKHHEYSALPDSSSSIKILPEHQNNHFYDVTPKPQYHSEPPPPPPSYQVPNNYQLEYQKLLDLMKHHNYNPTPEDLSSIKSLPELLEHLNIYKDPHPTDDEIPSKGLKVKSLPEYASPPRHHQYDGNPIEHLPPGVKALRPKSKPRPKPNPYPEEYYPSPSPHYPPPPPHSAHEPSSGHNHVSQLNPAAYTHLQKSQDPGLSHVSYLPIGPSYGSSMYFYPPGMTQMQPPTYFDQSKFKNDEPIKFRIKDIESLQRALKRAGISEDAMKNVILTKEDNGETHVQISVPIGELFKSMADHDNNNNSTEEEATAFTAPIFYNDYPKKDVSQNDNNNNIVVEEQVETKAADETPVFIESTSTTASTSQSTVTTTTSSTTVSTVTTTSTTKSSTTTEFVPKQVVLIKDETGVQVEEDDQDGGGINLHNLTRGNTTEEITPGTVYLKLQNTFKKCCLYCQI